LSDPTSKKSGMVEVYDIVSDALSSGASPAGGGVSPGRAVVVAGPPDPVGVVVVVGPSDSFGTIDMMGPSDSMGTVAAMGTLSLAIAVVTTGSPGSVGVRLASGVLYWGV